MSRQAALFGLVCAVGSVAALGLTVHEAGYVAPVQARVLSTSRAGVTTVALAEAHNTTGAPRCSLLRVAARDREGRDLAVTAPVRLALAPGARRRETVFLRVSRRDATERLERVDAFVTDC